MGGGARVPKGGSGVLVLALGLAALSLASRSRAEALRSLPTFGTGVEVVNLNLAVTDVSQRHVGNLDARELVLLENGEPQEITLFARETVPLSLGILIDGSSSMGRHLKVTRAAALRLIETLGPQDEAQIAQFDRRVRVLAGPTSDRAELEGAVRSLRANGETALHDALYVALQEVRAARGAGDLRRRALLVLSDGADTASLTRDEEVLDLARRAEVSVYTIGLPAPGVPSAVPGPDYFLSALARDTGGQAFFPASLAGLDGVFERIAEELRTLYAVGYVSRNLSRDGRWRPVAIHTSRGNLLVRHRPGYYAPKGALGPAPRLTR